MRLNYLSVYSDDDQEVLQIVYEDSDTGDTYIQRMADDVVTVVAINGVVSNISSSEFEVMKGDVSGAKV